MYRLAFGSKIVQSSYDFDTHKIGPYTCPIDIKYNLENQQGNAVSPYQYYELFRACEDVLAIFNNGNYCFVAIHTDYVSFEPFSASDFKLAEKLPVFPRGKKLSVGTYKHIGYLRTYQDCKAVYQWPWYLIQNVDTGEVPDISDKITGIPMENPPLSLYKELLKTDFNAVYFDTVTNKPIFIN